MIARAKTLGAALHGRDNNLSLLRMIAATSVLVSHAYPISSGAGTIEPLVAETGYSLGLFAVFLFFAISGLLIARSWDRRPDLIRFLAARTLRLYPALVVVLVLTVVAGAALTRLAVPAYLGKPATFTYVPSNLSLAFLQYPLPGVFETNPFGPAINGSLWTLVFEVVCYAGIALAGMLGLFRRPRLLTALLGAALVGCILASNAHAPWLDAWRIRSLALLAFPFALGTLAYIWRDRLPLSVWMMLALWLMAAVAWRAGTPMLLTAALAYTAFVFAFADTPALRRYNRLGDYSYGTYIYAFPMQQLVVWLTPGQTPLANMALALGPTLLCAVLSWHLVEQRSLARVGWWSERLHRLFAWRAAAG